MVLLFRVPPGKLWITALKLWINRADCGKVAQLFGLAPPYMAKVFPTLQNMDRQKSTKNAPAGLLKVAVFLPKLTTGCG
jgi:hypothetical protein